MALFAATVIALLVVGVLTRPSLCDEIYHWDFANEWYLGGGRPLFSARVHSLPEFNGYRVFEQAPLWGWIIQATWRMAGGWHQPMAHAVQLGFFILGIVGTYLLAKQLYGRQIGSWAGLLALSCPSLLAFAVLLQLDLPITAAAPWIILLAIRRRYVLLGAALGVGFLLKRNMACLAPAAYATILISWFRPTWVGMPAKAPRPGRGRMLAAFAATTVIGAVVVLPDLVFRFKEFGTISSYVLVPRAYEHLSPFKDPRIVGKLLTKEGLAAAEAAPEGYEAIAIEKALHGVILEVPRKHFGLYVYSNAWINSRRVPQFLGAGLLLGLAFCLADLLRGKCVRQDVIPFLAISVFAFTWIALAGWDPTAAVGIRYYIPVIPFLAILVGSRVINGGGAVRRPVIIVLCAVQLVSVPAYVYARRRTDRATSDTIAYLKTHASPGDRVLSPIHFVPYPADCSVVWDRPDFLYLLDRLFLAEDTEHIERILRRVKIRYILIPADKVYDAEELTTAAGYPTNFIENLERSDNISLVFKNRRFSIWHVPFKAGPRPTAGKQSQ